jgi:hypothetical protein
VSFSFRDVRYTGVVHVPDQASAARALSPGTLVLVMPAQRPKHLKLVCPCGCGEVLTVNLMREMGKAWDVWLDSERRVSLFPSVWLDAGCRSHFILRQNKARLLYGKMPRMTDEEFRDWWDYVPE